jgi:hypothetical protein
MQSDLGLRRNNSSRQPFSGVSSTSGLGMSQKRTANQTAAQSTISSTTNLQTNEMWKKELNKLINKQGQASSSKLAKFSSKPAVLQQKSDSQKKLELVGVYQYTRSQLAQRKGQTMASEEQKSSRKNLHKAKAKEAAGNMLGAQAVMSMKTNRSGHLSNY